MPNVGFENLPLFDAPTVYTGSVTTTAQALSAIFSGIKGGGLCYLQNISDVDITLCNSGGAAGTGFVLAANAVSPPILLTAFSSLFAVHGGSGSKTLAALVQA